MLGIRGVEISRRPVKHQGEALAFNGDELAVIAPLGRACLWLPAKVTVCRWPSESVALTISLRAVHHAHEQRAPSGVPWPDWNFNFSFRCRRNADVGFALCAIQLPDKIKLA